LVGSGTVIRRTGWMDGGTYGESALDFCAADFEIGQARYAWVFLEFCPGAMLAAVYCLKDDRVCT